MILILAGERDADFGGKTTSSAAYNTWTFTVTVMQTATGLLLTIVGSQPAVKAQIKERAITHGDNAR